MQPSKFHANVCNHAPPVSVEQSSGATLCKRLYCTGNGDFPPKSWPGGCCIPRRATLECSPPPYLTSQKGQATNTYRVLTQSQSFVNSPLSKLPMVLRGRTLLGRTLGTKVGRGGVSSDPAPFPNDSCCKAQGPSEKPRQRRQAIAHAARPPPQALSAHRESFRHQSPAGLQALALPTHSVHRILPNTSSSGPRPALLFANVTCCHRNRLGGI